MCPDTQRPGSWVTRNWPAALALMPLSAIGAYSIPAMNPTRDSTYQFLYKFIGEMTALFPDAYFHVGGDECNGKEWDPKLAHPAIHEGSRASKTTLRFRLISPGRCRRLSPAPSQDHGGLGRGSAAWHSEGRGDPVLARTPVCWRGGETGAIAPCYQPVTISI